jgi:hypothetical protein
MSTELRDARRRQTIHIPSSLRAITPFLDEAQQILRYIDKLSIEFNIKFVIFTAYQKKKQMMLKGVSRYIVLIMRLNSLTQLMRPLVSLLRNYILNYSDISYITN